MVDLFKSVLSKLFIMFFIVAVSIGIIGIILGISPLLSSLLLEISVKVISIPIEIFWAVVLSFIICLLPVYLFVFVD